MKRAIVKGVEIQKETKAQRELETHTPRRQERSPPDRGGMGARREDRAMETELVAHSSLPPSLHTLGEVNSPRPSPPATVHLPPQGPG